jgi:hypothetical protein
MQKETYPLREKMTCFGTIILYQHCKSKGQLLGFQHNQILRKHFEQNFDKTIIQSNAMVHYLTM